MKGIQCNAMLYNSMTFATGRLPPTPLQGSLRLWSRYQNRSFWHNVAGVPVLACVVDAGLLRNIAKHISKCIKRYTPYMKVYTNIYKRYTKSIQKIKTNTSRRARPARLGPEASRRPTRPGPEAPRRPTRSPYKPAGDKSGGKTSLGQIRYQIHKGFTKYTNIYKWPFDIQSIF